MNLSSRRWLRRGKRWFLGHLLIGSLSGLAAVVAFNVLMNPLGIWPDVLGTPVNQLLLARVNSVRMVKAYDLMRRPGKRPGTQRPDALITGLSTVAWGIDPNLYPVEGEVLYNGGLPGSSIEEQYQYLKVWLRQVPTVKKVYLELNFASFNKMTHLRKDFAFERMSVPFPTLSDVCFSCGTRYALASSCNTWRLNQLGRIKQMSYDSGNGYHQRVNGTHANYRANLDMMLRNNASMLLMLDKAVDEAQIGFLARIIELCRSKSVELVLYFGPQHAWMYEQERFTGFINARAALRRRVAEMHPFWDFCLCNEIVGESADHLDHFVDQIHYRPRTGGYILATINGRRPSHLPKSFGVLISRRNIDQHLDRWHRSYEQWREDRPEEVRYIQEYYREVQSRLSSRLEKARGSTALKASPAVR